MRVRARVSGEAQCALAWFAGECSGASAAVERGGVNGPVKAVVCMDVINAAGLRRLAWWR